MEHVPAFTIERQNGPQYPAFTVQEPRHVEMLTAQFPPEQFATTGTETVQSAEAGVPNEPSVAAAKAKPIILRFIRDSSSGLQ